MLIETERKEKKSDVQILTSHSGRPISKEAAKRVREMYNPIEDDEDDDKKDEGDS